MDKVEAIKKAIENKKEANNKAFQDEVEDLVWRIEKTSQNLRELKKRLLELKPEEVIEPDLSDCL